MDTFSIFDLDGTVICSNHRKATLPNGSLDLPHWIENNTPSKIARDSMLPAYRAMVHCWNRGDTVIICTARVLQDADFEFFMENGIMSHATLSRPNGCTMADHLLKDIQLRLYADNAGLSWKRFCAKARIYDDNEMVLSHLSAIGLRGVNAVRLNARLAA